MGSVVGRRALSLSAPDFSYWVLDLAFLSCLFPFQLWWNCFVDLCDSWSLFSFIIWRMKWIHVPIAVFFPLCSCVMNLFARKKILIWILSWDCSSLTRKNTRWISERERPWASQERNPWAQSSFFHSSKSTVLLPVPLESFSCIPLFQTLNDVSKMEETDSYEIPMKTSVPNSAKSSLKIQWIDMKLEAQVRNFKD